MDEVVKDANDCLHEANEGWRHVYKAASDDLKFLLGGEHQWDERQFALRRSAHLPTLTFNYLAPFVRQVTNNIRQITPSVRFIPADSKADPETAELLQGIYRNIEYVSSADIAYDTAAEYAVKCGIGFIQVDHDYVSPDAFEQHIVIRTVPNPLSIVVDPNMVGLEPAYGFKIDKMLVSEFKKLYPKAGRHSFDADFIRENAPAFADGDDYVTVAEWFKREDVDKTVLLLSDGSVVYEDDLEKLEGPFEVVNSRTVRTHKVTRRKMTGAEVLEESEFPSRFVPLVPVFGEEHWADGKRHYVSLIRNAKDAARMVNLWKSKETEYILRGTNAQWLVPEGQLAGYEKEWENPDGAQVLRYKTTDAKGNPSAPPQRIAPPGVPSGAVNASRSAVDDLKASIGLFNASLGAEGTEKSGRAIIARQKQGDLATFHFVDNLSRSVEQVGRIVGDMIPKVYDTPRIVRIMGEDEAPKAVAINGARPLSPKDRLYDIRTGKYDVLVKTGAAYATKRQEAIETLSAMAQGNPALAQVASYFVAKNMDTPGAEQMADAIKKMLPPGLIEETDSETPDLRPIVAKLEAEKAQLEQAAQMERAQIEQVMAAAEQEIMSLRSKLAEAESGQEAYEARIKEEELRLKQAEVDLKRMDLAIKRFDVEKEADSKERQLTLEEEKLAAEVRIAEIEAQNKVMLAQYSPEYLAHTEAVKSADTAAVAIANDVAVRGEIQANVFVTALQSLQATLAEMARPKVVTPVRDKSGRIERIVSE